jgi:hypothetical protein
MILDEDTENGYVMSCELRATNREPFLPWPIAHGP